MWPVLPAFIWSDARGIRVGTRIMGTLIRDYRFNCWDPAKTLIEMATLLIFIQKVFGSNLG